MALKHPLWVQIAVSLVPRADASCPGPWKIPSHDEEKPGRVGTKAKNHTDTKNSWSYPWDSEGQGSLACCSSWGHKESDMTYRLNHNNKWILSPIIFPILKSTLPDINIDTLAVFWLGVLHYFIFIFSYPLVRKIPWRRKQQPTPVFLPEEFHGQRSLAGCSSYSCTELDTTEMTLLSKVFDYVVQNELWKILRYGNASQPCLSPEKPVYGSKSNK